MDGIYNANLNSVTVEVKRSQYGVLIFIRCDTDFNLSKTDATA